MASGRFDASLDTAATSADATLMPRMTEFGEILGPAFPSSLKEAGIEPAVAGDLALKYASTVRRFTSEHAADELCLPIQIVNDLLARWKTEKLVQIFGQQGPFSFDYGITNLGREQALRLLEISGYVGPVPVSMASYTAMLEWQIEQWPATSFERVQSAIAPIVLNDDVVRVAAMAVVSGKSLFLFGPAGNGKTSLGRLLHTAQSGRLWIPHCVNLDSHIIRIFDPQTHRRVPAAASDKAGRIDRRWVLIERPFIVSGGEMTMDSLDLNYSPSLRFYEAPLHMKANGGTFLIDDFGRQRIDPHDLLNRWIVPMEHRIDHLTLHGGRKLDAPFRLMLIIATNLPLEKVSDPAFLRRMGYRLCLDSPTPDSYARIFERYAESCGVSVGPQVIPMLLERYRAEDRELRACEPRDLIERAKDVCQLCGWPLELTEEVLAIAWQGYFGQPTA